MLYYQLSILFQQFLEAWNSKMTKKDSSALRLVKTSENSYSAGVPLEKIPPLFLLGPFRRLFLILSTTQNVLLIISVPKILIKNSTPCP